MIKGRDKITCEENLYVGTLFRTYTPKSVYSKKIYTGKSKELLDIEAIKDKIDFSKVEDAKKDKNNNKAYKSMCT